MSADLARVFSVVLCSLLAVSAGGAAALAQSGVTDGGHRTTTAVAVELIDALLPLIPQATADDRATVARLLHGAGTVPGSSAFEIDVSAIDCRYQIGHPEETECWVAMAATPRISVKSAQADGVIAALLKAGVAEDAAMGGRREVQMTALTCTINDPSARKPTTPEMAAAVCLFTDPLEG